jgi:hypothetical protein
VAWQSTTSTSSCESGSEASNIRDDRIWLTAAAPLVSVSYSLYVRPRDVRVWIERGSSRRGRCSPPPSNGRSLPVGKDDCNYFATAALLPRIRFAPSNQVGNDTIAAPRQQHRNVELFLDIFKSRTRTTFDLPIVGNRDLTGSAV